MKENRAKEEALVIKAQKRMSIGTAYFYTNQIICFEFDDDIFTGIAEVKELANTAKELTGGVVPVLSLVVTGQRNNISTEAFAFDVHKELGIKQITIAEAVVIKNLATRIMANFYYKVTKREFPVKVFDTKEEAIKWLLSNNFTEQ
ncbi:MAG: hypothetical protein IPG89_21460 [Bacteroidetes bacterium]|nr:hypothetical protein [Bacteroidota bacterium]